MKVENLEEKTETAALTKSNLDTIAGDIAEMIENDFTSYVLVRSLTCDIIEVLKCSMGVINRYEEKN